MSESPPTLPSKQSVAEELLGKGTMFVHIDPRRDGVVVPSWHRNEPQLVLQLGWDMPVPIRDLCIDEDGLSGTLSFNRSPFFCSVRWDAVFALAGEDGRGMVWPDSIPPEIQAEVQREAARLAADPPPKLELLAGKPSSDDHADADTPTGAASRKLPPYLRVIK